MGRPGRPRLPVAVRAAGRGSRVLCAATNLAPEELELLDAMAARTGETRSEWIRNAVRARMLAMRGEA